MEPFQQRIANLSPARLTLLAIELQEKLLALETAAHEPIAIVSMACRLPGGADTPAALWELLESGSDTIDEVSADRLRLSTYHQPTMPDSAARWGAFLNSIEMFDPRFFNISPSEAVSMDPQQRLLLEVCWEALENAGIPPDSLAGSETGVLIGIASTDYAMLANAYAGDNLNKYLVTGASNSIAVGRISYLLGLQGPNMAIDTSCSSSATSIHLACQSLRRGEIDLALAGGVSLALLPQITETLARFDMLARDGHCKTFSEQADGFARGEGCGVVLLKRLSDAQRDRDNILAVVRGTGCNQDGRTNGLTAPNGRAQERVILAALKDAGLTPADIDLVEAHGTGTSLGDPIEVSALGRVFAQRVATQPVALGSIKTNIGHLEAAAGIAGILKVLLALEHETMPPNLHTEPRSTRIPWNDLPFTVPTTPQPWKAGARKRIAGVSSFGFSGTNVHLVLEEAPIRIWDRKPSPAAHIITASAKSQPALKALALRYAEYLAMSPTISLADFAYSVNLGRSHLSHRLSAVVHSTEEARKVYADFASGVPGGAEAYRYAPERPMADPESYPPAGPHLGGPSYKETLGTLSSLYLSGATIDWRSIPGSALGPKLVLPNYPFERRPYWLDPLPVPIPSPNPASSVQDAAWNELQPWLYKLAWEPVVATEPPSVPEESSTVDQIMASMLPLLEEAASTTDYSFLPRFRIECNALSVQFILDALEKNGLHLSPGDRLPADLCGSLNIPRKYERLVARIVQILQQEDVLAAEGTALFVKRQPIRIDTKLEVQRLRETYPEVHAELNLFARACYLGSVLKGSRSGLEILFPDGSLTLADELYRETLHARTMNPLVAKIVAKAVAFLSSNRKLRILELGGGTGSTTRQVLPLLPADRVEYVFTDVSKLFLARAEKQFGEFPFVTYSILDIEPQPQVPGEISERFDLILAANVLHATKSLRSTLTNVKSLLQPDGFLLLLEASRTERLADITLGTIEGWWRFEDADLRQSSALISPELWVDLLAEQGFTSALLPSEPRLGGIPADEPVILSQLGRSRKALASHKAAILIAPSSLVADELASQLRERGVAVTHFLSGRLPDSPLQPDRRAGLLAAIDNALSNGADAIDIVVLVASPPDAFDIAQQAHDISSQAISLVQDVLSCARPVASLCFVVSAQDALSLTASVLTGLVRVLQSEHPSLRCRVIHGAAEKSTRISEIIAKNALPAEPELALRGKSILAPRLRPAPLAFKKIPQFQASGSYLVTGAFGVLGIALTRWLAERGAGTLVLFGRRTPSSAAERAIEDIRDTGTRVVTLTGDVSSEDDVASLFEQIAQSGVPLRGVFHAAAVLEDSTILNLSSASVARVLSPKVTGAWLLHRHTEHLPLDYFVLLSSAASVLGTPGQANYAMANTFLDALAHYRHALGRPAISIDWGPWASSGADVKRDFLDDWTARGGTSISQSQGFALLDGIIQSELPQIAVLPLEPAALAPGLQAERTPAILRGAFVEGQRAPSGLIETESVLKEQLNQAALRERPDILLRYVETRLVQLLQLDATMAIPVEMSFLQLGLDSLMALEIKNGIESVLELSLPHTMFFDYPNLSTLRQYFSLVTQAGVSHTHIVNGSDEQDQIRL